MRYATTATTLLFSAIIASTATSQTTATKAKAALAMAIAVADSKVEVRPVGVRDTGDAKVGEPCPFEEPCYCGCESGGVCRCRRQKPGTGDVGRSGTIGNDSKSVPTVTYYYPPITPATYQYYRPVRSFGITSAVVPRYQPMRVYRGAACAGGG